MHRLHVIAIFNEKTSRELLTKLEKKSGNKNDFEIMLKLIIGSEVSSRIIYRICLLCLQIL